MKKFASILALGLAAIMLSACSTTDEEAALRGTEYGIYQDVQSYLRSENYAMAIEKLQLLESRFPFGKYAEQAQLELIYAHYKASDHPEAVAAAERFIRLHPQHPNVDYAYYVKGLSAFTEGSSMFDRFMPTDMSGRDPSPARLSFSDFAELIARFPDSEYAADARARMIYLRNLMAHHEIVVANYYLKREAYVAAARRGQFVVETFPGSTSVPDGLAVMIHSYSMLGLHEQANNALSVLKANYPNYPNLTAEGKFKADGYDENGEKTTWLNKVTFGLFDAPEPPQFDTRHIYGS